MQVSIAVPVFNEGQGIVGVVTDWYNYLNKCSAIRKFEIVLCNDGSTDNTSFLLEDLAESYPQIKILHLKNNQGAAVALYTAIKASTLEWVLMTDADGQFPLTNLKNMIANINANTDAIFGMRKKKSKLLARWGSLLSGLVCNWIHGSRVQDFNCVFKLVKGEIIRSLVLEARGMNYSTEITSKLLEKKVNFQEVIIEHREREFGTSKLKLFRDSWQRLLFVFYLALRQLLIKANVLRLTHDNV